MKSRDKETNYRTKQLADSIGVHVNTIRFYEEMGFLTKPDREKNGYRRYTELQMDQCKLIRLAMRAEVLQNGLRQKAIDIIRYVANGQYDEAIVEAQNYREMIYSEIKRANDAITFIENREKTTGNVFISNCLYTKQKGKTNLNGASPEITADDIYCTGREEAARSLNVTEETVRTWERSGLVHIHKVKGGQCRYTVSDMERLNMIRTLRSADYSISAILRLIHYLDDHTDSENQSIGHILNTPAAGEEIVSVCDRLVHSLDEMSRDAKNLLEKIQKLRSEYI